MFKLIGGKKFTFLIQLLIILIVLEKYLVNAENTNKKIYYFENDKGVSFS